VCTASVRAGNRWATVVSSKTVSALSVGTVYAREADGDVLKAG
jgi:hypothetical protein